MTGYLNDFLSLPPSLSLLLCAYTCFVTTEQYLHHSILLQANARHRLTSSSRSGSSSSSSTALRRTHAQTHVVASASSQQAAMIQLDGGRAPGPSRRCLLNPSTNGHRQFHRLVIIPHCLWQKRALNAMSNVLRRMLYCRAVHERTRDDIIAILSVRLSVHRPVHCV